MYSNNTTKYFLSNLISCMMIILIFSPSVYSKEVIGWVENVGVSSSNVIVKAKIDTGADSSSMHCDCITPYERDGELWVRFSVADIEGEQVSFERKILRNVKVKRHFGDVQQRYVVRMGFCIGEQYEETDVSLVDRSGFNYNLLVGRKYLKDKFVVDPAKKFTVSPQCNAD